MLLTIHFCRRFHGQLLLSNKNKIANSHYEKRKMYIYFFDLLYQINFYTSDEFMNIRFWIIYILTSPGWEFFTVFKNINIFIQIYIRNVTLIYNSKTYLWNISYTLSSIQKIYDPYIKLSLVKRIYISYIHKAWIKEHISFYFHLVQQHV